MGWKRPLGEVIRVVAEVPAGDGNRLVGGVPELDPVRALAIFVEESGPVLGHELGNQDGIQGIEGRGACGIAGVAPTGNFGSVLETITIGVAGHGVRAPAEFLKIGEVVEFGISRMVLAEVSEVPHLPFVGEAVAIGIF